MVTRSRVRSTTSTTGACPTPWSPSSPRHGRRVRRRLRHPASRYITGSTRSSPATTCGSRAPPRPVHVDCKHGAALALVLGTPDDNSRRAPTATWHQQLAGSSMRSPRSRTAAIRHASPARPRGVPRGAAARLPLPGAQRTGPQDPDPCGAGRADGGQDRRGLAHAEPQLRRSRSIPPEQLDARATSAACCRSSSPTGTSTSTPR